MLDRARLGKQRVEVWQLLNGSFPHHPASIMWQGYEHALTAYGIICCKYWIRMGHDDSILPALQGRRQALIELGTYPLVWPWWYGHPAMVCTHQSKLYHKGSPKWVALQERVGKPAGMEPMRLPYLWPQFNEGHFRLSTAEAKRGDWEIPSAWSYDPKTRDVVPR